MQLAQPHTHSLTVHVKAQIEAVTISEIHRTYTLSLSQMVLNTKTSILCLELRPVQRKGKEKREIFLCAYKDACLKVILFCFDFPVL